MLIKLHNINLNPKLSPINTNNTAIITFAKKVIIKILPLNLSLIINLIALQTDSIPANIATENNLLYSVGITTGTMYPILPPNKPAITHKITTFFIKIPYIKLIEI